MIRRSTIRNLLSIACGAFFVAGCASSNAWRNQASIEQDTRRSHLAADPALAPASGARPAPSLPHHGFDKALETANGKQPGAGGNTFAPPRSLPPHQARVSQALPRPIPTRSPQSAMPQQAIPQQAIQQAGLQQAVLQQAVLQQAVLQQAVPQPPSPQLASMQPGHGPTGNGPGPSARLEIVEAQQPFLTVDLPTALRLAGADNLQIALAAERVQRAHARVARADAMWIPSLRGAMLYNHSGRIQATNGVVGEAARSSLFVGGGVGTGAAPLTGAAGGPARMMVDLSLSDIFFEPLARRQVVQRADAELATTFNETLASAALAYQDLVRGRAELAVADEAIVNAGSLVRITEQFADAGAGLQADVERSRAELSLRKRQRFEAVEATSVAAARLARLLQLDATVELQPAETELLPLDLVDADLPAALLVAQAMEARPELREADAVVAQSEVRLSQERLRPVLPHLYAGVSFGGFGGSGSSDINGLSDRADLDVAAVWELENMGLGYHARRREQESVNRQALLAGEDLRNAISAEVVEAHARVVARRSQLQEAKQRVQQSQRSLTLSMEGIQGLQLRPIEAHQAVAALAAARREQLDVIQQYNAAQFNLLRAIGQPPSE